jgi:hypothetical protein
VGLADMVILVQILQKQRTVIFDITITHIAKQAASSTQHGIAYLCVGNATLTV